MASIEQNDSLTVECYHVERKKTLTQKILDLEKNKECAMNKLKILEEKLSDFKDFFDSYADQQKNHIYQVVDEAYELCIFDQLDLEENLSILQDSIIDLYNQIEENDFDALNNCNICTE